MEEISDSVKFYITIWWFDESGNNGIASDIRIGRKEHKITQAFLEETMELIKLEQNYKSVYIINIIRLEE